jgi:hypothetical protein
LETKNAHLPKRDITQLLASISSANEIHREWASSEVVVSGRDWLPTKLERNKKGELMECKLTPAEEKRLYASLSRIYNWRKKKGQFTVYSAKRIVHASTHDGERFYLLFLASRHSLNSIFSPPSE